MTVDTHELHRARRARTINCSLRIAVAEVETKLRIVLPRAHELVGVYINPWGDAQLHARRRQTTRD